MEALVHLRRRAERSPQDRSVALAYVASLRRHGLREDLRAFWRRCFIKDTIWEELELDDRPPWRAERTCPCGAAAMLAASPAAFEARLRQGRCVAVPEDSLEDCLDQALTERDGAPTCLMPALSLDPFHREPQEMAGFYPINRPWIIPPGAASRPVRRPGFLRRLVSWGPAREVKRARRRVKEQPWNRQARDNLIASLLRAGYGREGWDRLRRALVIGRPRRRNCGRGQRPCRRCGQVTRPVESLAAFEEGAFLGACIAVRAGEAEHWLQHLVDRTTSKPGAPRFPSCLVVGEDPIANGGPAGFPGRWVL